MATAKRVRLQGGQPSRWKRNLLLLAGLVAALLIAIAWSTLSVRGRASASFAARTACVCHYISHRDIASCKADLGEDGDSIHFSSDAATKSITARYLILARQTARYDVAHGCVLERWES